ncbi:MAG: hypothetical protein P8179_00940 [Candidatus Thiodiazotropha sp.]
MTSPTERKCKQKYKKHLQLYIPLTLALSRKGRGDAGFEPWREQAIGRHTVS